jgi:uncharacterized protein (UPF0335 family)
MSSGMQCSRCGSTIMPGAAFCANCGLVATGGGAAAVMAARQKNVIWTIGAILAAVLAVFLALLATGVLRFGAALPQTAIRAPAEAPDGSLRVAAKPDEPVLKAGDKQITMPPEVRAWLEHLERMERKKNRIHEDMTNEAKIMERMLSGSSGIDSVDVGTILDPEKGMPDPRMNVSEMFQEMAQPWRDLRREFLNTGPPMPAECRPLANAFAGGLAAIPEQIESLESVMSGFDPANPEVRAEAKSATDSARKVGREHKRPVDAEFAEADVLLANICRKYSTEKWFDINTGTLRGSPFGR